MAQALATGEIDAFCVGEPWGSMAVETGVGALLLPGTAIWAFAPEKVLAVRHDWAEREPGLSAQLIRAVWRAGRWLDDPHNHVTAAEIMARPAYLDVPSEVIERSLSGRLVISAWGEERQTDPFVAFHAGAAGFPWQSQAAWIGTQLAGRLGLDRALSAAAAREVFRTDLYRTALRATGADLPAASQKVEGSIDAKRAAASESGELILWPDRFFDGKVFDPLDQMR
jgi:two-component system, oxyanion-binding sensor